MTSRTSPLSDDTLNVGSRSPMTFAKSLPGRQTVAESRLNQSDQSSTNSASRMSIDAAFETLEIRINDLIPAVDNDEPQVTSSSSDLISIRERALKLCEKISEFEDSSRDSHYHPQNPRTPDDESAVEVTGDQPGAFDDEDGTDSSSEASFTLIDPVDSTSYPSDSEGYDKRNRVDKADFPSDMACLPEWACTTTAGGCKVPLFWEGADMGYFEWHQERLESGERTSS